MNKSPAIIMRSSKLSLPRLYSVGETLFLLGVFGLGLLGLRGLNADGGSIEFLRYHTGSDNTVPGMEKRLKKKKYIHGRLLLGGNRDISGMFFLSRTWRSPPLCPRIMTPFYFIVLFLKVAKNSLDKRLRILFFFRALCLISTWQATEFENSQYI